jgi:hypothetical protein
MARKYHVQVSDNTVVLNPVKRCRVEVNRNAGKVEVIVRHRGKRIRLLCDKDAIHVGRKEAL